MRASKERIALVCLLGAVAAPVGAQQPSDLKAAPQQQHKGPARAAKVGESVKAAAPRDERASQTMTSVEKKRRETQDNATKNIK